MMIRLFDRTVLEVDNAEPDAELRAAARRVLGLIAPPPAPIVVPGDAETCQPTFDWNRRTEAWPALAELRRLAGY